MVLEFTTSIFILTYLYGSYMTCERYVTQFTFRVIPGFTVDIIKMHFKYKKVNTMRLKKRQSNLLIFQFVQAILKHDIGFIKT